MQESTARFDRQIRLYGLDSQSKLASASVLLVAGNENSVWLVEEILKNLLLAGIGSIDLLDRQGFCSKPFSAKDTPRILSNAHIDLIQRCSQLNPDASIRCYKELSDLHCTGWTVVLVMDERWITPTHFQVPASQFIWCFLEGTFGLLKHGAIPNSISALKRPSNATQSLVFWLAKRMQLEQEKIFEMLGVAPFEVVQNGELSISTCSILAGFACQLAIRIVTGTTAIWSGNCISVDCSGKSLSNVFDL